MKRLDDKWYPISELPEEFKDGRAVLIWCELWEHRTFCVTATYATYNISGYWETSGPSVDLEIVTHFREIVSPQEEALRDLAEYEESIGRSY